MKFQKEELAAVADYIHREIEKKHEVKLTKAEEAQVKKYYDLKEKTRKKIMELQNEAQELQNEINVEYKRMRKSVGIPENCYISGEDFDKTVAEAIRLRRKAIPSVDQLRKEIIMKSLFADEKELKTFIEELIKKY